MFIGFSVLLPDKCLNNNKVAEQVVQKTPLPLRAISPGE
jgi:hypothetical protein